MPLQSFTKACHSLLFGAKAWKTLTILNYSRANAVQTLCKRSAKVQTQCKRSANVAQKCKRSDCRIAILQTRELQNIYSANNGNAEQLFCGNPLILRAVGPLWAGYATARRSSWVHKEFDVKEMKEAACQK